MTPNYSGVNKACSHCKLDSSWFETGLAECAFNPHWCEWIVFTLQSYPSEIHTLINTSSHPRLQVSCDCFAQYPRTRWLLYTHCRNVYFVECDDGPQRSIFVVAATDNVLAFEYVEVIYLHSTLLPCSVIDILSQLYSEPLRPAHFEH